MAKDKKKGAGFGAEVVNSGLNADQQELQGAKNDVATLSYALAKATAAQEHADAQVAEYSGLLATARKRLAAANARRPPEDVAAEHTAELEAARAKLKELEANG